MLLFYFLDYFSVRRAINRHMLTGNILHFGSQHLEPQWHSIDHSYHFSPVRGVHCGEVSVQAEKKTMNCYSYSSHSTDKFSLSCRKVNSIIRKFRVDTLDSSVFVGINFCTFVKFRVFFSECGQCLHQYKLLSSLKLPLTFDLVGPFTNEIYKIGAQQYWWNLKLSSNLYSNKSKSLQGSLAVLYLDIIRGLAVLGRFATSISSCFWNSVILMPKFVLDLFR